METVMGEALPCRATLYTVTIHGRRAWLQDLIASIRGYTAPSYPLIVVDNGSRDGTAEWLAEQAGITTIRNEENRGQAVAGNQVLRRATTDYLIHLDTDALITQPGWLEEIVAFMDAHPEVGLAGDGWACGWVLEPEHCQFFPSGWVERTPRAERERLLFIQYGGLVLRRRMVAEIGGFHEGLPEAYMDLEDDGSPLSEPGRPWEEAVERWNERQRQAYLDVEYSFRAQAWGWQVARLDSVRSRGAGHVVREEGPWKVLHPVDDGPPRPALLERVAQTRPTVEGIRPREAPPGWRWGGGSCQLTAEGLVLEGPGWSNVLLFPRPGRDVRLKLRVRIDSGALFLKLRLPSPYDPDAESYHVLLGEFNYAARGATWLGLLEPPPEGEFEVVWEAVGTQLSLFLNSQLVQTFHDDQLTEGYAAFGVKDGRLFCRHWEVEVLKEATLASTPESGRAGEGEREGHAPLLPCSPAQAARAGAPRILLAVQDWVGVRAALPVLHLLSGRPDFFSVCGNAALAAPLCDRYGVQFDVALEPPPGEDPFGETASARCARRYHEWLEAYLARLDLREVRLFISNVPHLRGAEAGQRPYGSARCAIPWTIAESSLPILLVQGGYVECRAVCDEQRKFYKAYHATYPGYLDDARSVFLPLGPLYYDFLWSAERPPSPFLEEVRDGRPMVVIFLPLCLGPDDHRYVDRLVRQHPEYQWVLKERPFGPQEPWTGETPFTRIHREVEGEELIAHAAALLVPRYWSSLTLAAVYWNATGRPYRPIIWTGCGYPDWSRIFAQWCTGEMALRRSEELMWLWQRMIAQGWMLNGDGLSFPEALAQARQTADAAALRESLGDCYSFFDGRSSQRFLQVVEQLLEHGQAWEPDPEAS